MSNPEPQPRPEQEPEGESLSLNKPQQSEWTLPTGPQGGDSGQHSRPGANYPPAPPARPYSPSGYGEVPLHERTSSLALAGFITALASAFLDLTIIFAFLGFLGSITAIVLSIVGLVRDVNGRHMKGRGFALTGIIVGATMLVLSTLVFVLLIIIGLASDDSSACANNNYSASYSCSLDQQNNSVPGSDI